MADAGSGLEKFLVGVDPERAVLVRALDRIVREAHPGFDVDVKYNLLMYALNRDWRHWVCAIDAHPKRGVGLRFLYGVILEDPRHVLRGGSSVLKTWDFGPGDSVDEPAVAGYVREAVAKYPEYRANDKVILASSRAATGRAPGAEQKSAG